ncbi:ABC transporter permease [Kurthia sibirica]|uniref:ABC transporter permease n=1 Tax=Kurthia sibirica TaxID=202750 RepID=UPI001172C34D|nr:ABC transporter permease [Kurthia sibirica]GEK34775.1 hypothetical protein KSI01_23080 [Kurthia sibirica]
MIKLIKNEWVKLWAKKATWVMLIMSILSIFILLGGMKWISSLDNTNDWKKNQQITINEMQKELDSGQLDAKEAKMYKDDLTLAHYKLEHDIDDTNMNTGGSFLSNSKFLVMFISLFSVIVAAGIVSFEFSTGTIKMLLTRPIARWKILLSKLLTTFIFSITLGLLTYVISLLSSLVFFSEKGQILTVVGNKVIEKSPAFDVLKEYGLAYGEITMSVLFAFMLGTLFRSSSLAIGLTLFITFASGTFIALLSQYTFVKYLWFSVTDLSGILADTSFIPGLTIGFALTIMAIYAVIFIIVSFLIFNKRDVTA